MLSNQPERIKALVIIFLKELQNKGFYIGVDTYLDALKLTDKYLQENSFASLEKLSKHLSPLICRNSQEQKDFQYQFDHLVIEQHDQWLNSYVEQLWVKFREEKKKRKSQHIIVSAITFLLLTVFCVLSFVMDIGGFFKPQIDLGKNTVHYKEVGDSYVKEFDSILQSPKDTQKLQIEQYFEGQEFKSRNFNYGFDLNTPGEKKLVTHIYSKKYGINDTITDTLRISPKVDISINRQQSIAYIDLPTSFELVKKDTITLPYAWYIIRQKDTVLALKNYPVFTYTFTDTGYYDVCVRYLTESDIFLSKFPKDHFATYLEQRVSKDEITISIDPVPLPENLDYRVNMLWIVMLLVVMTSCVFYIVWLYHKIKKVRAEPFQIIKAQLDPLDGKDPPFEITYESNDDNVSENKLLKKLSGHFLKTTETSIRKLDFKKTILGTVKNLGLINPAYKYKKKLVYYLILIDEEYSNSQQFKLFNYLVNLFVKKTENFDVYYFNQFPDTLYKSGETEGISLNQITNVYVDSTLLIFSSGHSLIDYRSPSIISPFNTILQYWYKRILITPISFNDWGKKETVLNATFDLVPADIVGLLDIVRLIQEQPDIPDVMSRNNLATYSSMFVDFQSIEALTSYLDNDDELLQWLCALAVYHKIQWEMTLEIGKNILGANHHKINYENLLKFSRIKWMYEGQFSEYVRLMLLKTLYVDNELKARATVLNMLDKVVIDSSAFSYEEKMVATYINSFFLFAASPEKKAVYQPVYNNEIQIQRNAEKFITLYESKRFSDVATDIYISKEEGNREPEKKWETPITVGGRNVGIKEYLKNKYEGEVHQQVSEIKNKIILPASLAVLLLIILTGLFSFKEGVFNANINNNLGLIDIVKLGSDSSFVTILPPCDELIKLAGNKEIGYTIFRNGTELNSDSLNAKDTSIIGFPSSLDTISIIFNINNAIYSTSVNGNSNTNYYFLLKSPVCDSAPRDTINFHVPPGRKKLFSLLIDSLTNAGELALINEDQPVSDNNYIDIYRTDKSKKASALSGAVTTLLNTSLSIRQISGITSTTIHVRIGNIELQKTVFIQICLENDRIEAQGFADTLNKHGRYLAPGVELQLNKCYNEVRYFNSTDEAEAQNLARQASDYFNVDVKAIPSTLRSINGYNKLELWISLPPRPRILWVDDYPDANNTVDIKFFKENNIQLDIAATNYDGFLKMNSNVYAYVITDIGRTNSERCVINKDKAGVEFAEQVIFAKDYLFVCSSASTIESNRAQLLKAGIPSKNLTSDKDYLQQTILSNIKKGNKSQFIQSMDCDQVDNECNPVERGNYYTLFYLWKNDELNPASLNMLNTILNRVSKEDKYAVTVNSYAYSGVSRDENLILSNKHLAGLRSYFPLGIRSQPGSEFNALGDGNPQREYSCDRIEITLTKIKKIEDAKLLIVDTVPSTFVGYRSATGNKWENIPIKNLGIALTLAENPKNSTATFEFEVQNGSCPNKFTGSKKVLVGNPTPIFSSCGLTLIIKLTQVRNNVAYFEAYVGRETKAQNTQSKD